MGAWGSSVFSDDTALDCLEDVVSSKAPLNYMREAFDAALELKYLEYAEAQSVIVSAAIMDSLLNGTDHGGDEESLDTWLKRNAKLDVSSLKPLAVAALARVLADGSELRELWEENVDEYPKWRGGLESISKRLNA
jgi:Domain of unknown function (DUF4259)